MITINEAREWLRLDNSDNDEIITALLTAIPNYIEVSTGMTETQQNTEPLVYTVSKFILLWTCIIKPYTKKYKKELYGNGK
jgi:hypothetical protein